MNDQKIRQIITTRIGQGNRVCIGGPFICYTSDGLESALREKAESKQKEERIQMILQHCIT